MTRLRLEPPPEERWAKERVKFLLKEKWANGRVHERIAFKIREGHEDGKSYTIKTKSVMVTSSDVFENFGVS